VDFESGLGITTMAGRIAVLAFGSAFFIACLEAARRYYSRAFFHGFLVSAGIFLSFDVVVFHWIFGLHRVTSGPEANVIEPLAVLLGIVFIAYGLTREKSHVSRESK
jgi:uncharacterized membrane protein